MAKRLKCPACGVRGEFGDDVAFEVRGRFQGRAVQKCLNCGTGLFVKPPLGRVEVIPLELWRKMEERWEEEFGGDDQEADDYPVVAEAVQALFDESPEDLTPSVLVLASAAQDVAGVALRAMANADAEWAGLDLETAKAVVRCGAAYFVFAAARDETLRRYFADWLDVRPSEVASSLLDAYGEAFLAPGEAKLVSTMKERWDAGEKDRYGTAIGRMLWQAGGGVGMPPIDDVMRWNMTLSQLLDTFGQHFTSELERFAEGG